MATMNQLMTALRAADAAGATDDAKRIAQIIANQQRSGRRDGALGYSVDRAQQMLGKGVEVAGDLFGSDTVKSIGSDIVAQQERDIAAGGYQPTYTGSLADTYTEGGISSALGWIAEKAAENAATGGLAIAGSGAAALTAPFSVPAATLLSGGTLLASGVMGAGQDAMEQEEKLGGYDSKVAAGVGIIVGILDRFGAGKVIPKPKLATMTGEEIVEELIKKGKPNAAAEIGKRIAGSALSEAATETAQEAVVVGTTAAQGGQYTAEELRDRALESAVIGGAIGGGTRTGIEGTAAVGRGVRSAIPGGYTPADPEAAADFAQRLQAIAQRDGFDLNNVSNNNEVKGARAAVDQAHKEIQIDLKDIKNDVKTIIDTKDSDTEQVRTDKKAVQRAFEQARNKTKNTVGTAEMEATQRLLGNTAEGQQLLRLFRQSNELTTLHNQGYVGGLSQYTDALSPLPSNTGYSDRALIELPTRLGLSGAAAGATGGASVPIQLGAVAAGRGIDALTGRRSRVAKFVQDQANQRGTASPTAQSVRAARALADQQREQAAAEAKAGKAAEARENTRRGAPATPGSPQDTVEQATGLDRRGVADIINILESVGVSSTMQRAINEYRKSVDQGGTISNDMLSEFIKRINAMVDSDPRLQAKMVRPRVRGDEAQQQAAELDQRREQGKQENRKEVDRLIKQVNESNGIALSDKAILLAALTELKGGLGANPVSAALDIVSAAEAQLRKPQLAEKYLMPYVARIERQQKKSKK